MSKPSLKRLLPAATVLVLGGMLATTSGCRDKKKARSDISFHARGVVRRIEGVRRLVNNPARSDPEGRRPGGPWEAMRMATDDLENALFGLPDRIDKKATTRVEERKAAAEEAMAKFRELRPTLESLKFDKAEVNSKLDELASLVAKAEQE